MKKFLILLIIIFGLLAMVNAQSIGAIPSSIDFGNVEPGESIEQDIYLTVISTDSNENFTIDPSANGIGTASLFSGQFDNPEDISEQTSHEWWSFEEAVIGPEIVVEPENLQVSNPPTLNGVTRGTLDIPEDAEPGLRYGYINLNPDLSGGDGGAGARLVSPTRVRYSFYVEGEPQRDIVVRDVRAFRMAENRAEVEVQLVNTGSVTASVEDFKFDIIDKNGRTKEATVEVNGDTLEPDESQYYIADWEEQNTIEEGRYEIDGQLSYFTGEAYASGSFTLQAPTNVVEVRPSNSPATNGQSNDGIPLWLVFMVLAILTVLMWSFDIEPFWILAITGGLAIASFILLSGVSNYLLVVLLMAVGIVVYGVM